MDTSQGINYTKSDGTVEDLETELTAVENRFGAVDASINEVRATVDNCYSPQKLPSRGTVENRNEFNPFIGYAGDVAINWGNEADGPNNKIGLHNGQHGPLATLAIKNLEMTETTVNNKFIGTVPTQSEVQNKQYPIGQIIYGYTRGSADKYPVGAIVYPGLEYNEGGYYTFCFRPGSISDTLPGKWVFLGHNIYPGTGEIRYGIVQRVE